MGLPLFSPPKNRRKLFVFHPAFGYFADSYGLKQTPLESQGKEPSAQQLAALIDKAKKEGVKVIFVEPQYSKKTAQTVATAIGGTLVTLDPLPRNYLDGIEDMARRIKKALSDQ